MGLKDCVMLFDADQVDAFIQKHDIHTDPPKDDCFKHKKKQCKACCWTAKLDDIITGGHKTLTLNGVRYYIVLAIDEYHEFSDARVTLDSKLYDSLLEECEVEHLIFSR